MMNINSKNNMRLELKNDLTIKGDIVAPDIHIYEYCHKLEILIDGFFIIPAKHYKEPDKYVRIGFSLLNGLFSDIVSSKNKYLILQVLENIVRDNYEMTLEIYKLFSLTPLIFELDCTADKINCINENIYGVSVWLEAWHNKEDTYNLKNSSFSWLEKIAFTNLKRYDMIREIHSNKAIEDIFSGHNSSWLIAEMSLLRHRLLNDSPSARQVYLNCKKHIDNLDYAGSPPEEYLSEDLMGNFFQYIDTCAYDLALNNKFFDSNFLKPYLTACKTENAHNKKAKLVLVPFVKQQNSLKPGLKLGQKLKPSQNP